MSKFLFIIFHLIVTCQIYLYSSVGVPTFLQINDEPLLTEMFTVNVGIMGLKNVGNIENIDPIDRQNVLSGIKNVLDKIPAIRLSKKAAILKAAKVYISKMKDKSDAKDKALFLEKKLFYSDDYKDNTLLSELFFEFRKDEDFNIIARKWFENLHNPFYILNVGTPFERMIKTESKICDEKKVNGKGPLDFLIHGEIERIDQVYFITIYIFSGLLKKKLKEITFVADSENLTEKTMDRFENVLSSVFKVKYASLKLDTTDDGIRMYLGNDYIGRDEVFLEFLVPGSYVLTLNKDNFEDKYININLLPYEIKKLFVGNQKEKELRLIDFYIEPLGTKIFINSVYQDKSPFQKALPKGKYVISMKNEFYEDHRYILSIDNMEEDKSTVVFHLKTKDINNLFKIKKILYYCAFWNFTFSLFTIVPVIVFAYDYFYKFGEAQMTYNLAVGGTGEVAYEYTPEGSRMKNTMQTLYGVAAVFVAYTGISLGWLFFSLADYLLTHEKKDFIPIIEYYHDLEGRDNLNLGMRIKF